MLLTDRNDGEDESGDDGRQPTICQLSQISLCFIAFFCDTTSVLKTSSQRSDLRYNDNNDMTAVMAAEAVSAMTLVAHFLTPNLISCFLSPFTPLVAKTERETKRMMG